MAETPENAAAAEFWRCAKCGTPNPLASYVKTCLGCGATRPVNARAIDRSRSDAARVEIRQERGRGLAAASWVYAAVVLIVLGLIRGVGNAWWPGTIVLFMPRWLWLLPIGALAAVSGWRRCFWPWILQAATAAVVAGPLMGLCVPWQRLWENPPAGDRLRVATYNLSLTPIKTDAFRRWVKRENLDVLFFQEGGTDSERLRPDLPEGWVFSPQAFLATRLPVVATYPRVVYDSAPGRLYGGHLERLRLRAPSGREFLVGSVHLPTIREGIEELFSTGDPSNVQRNTNWWAKQLAKILTTLSESTGDLPLLIGGDFNMPADDATMAALHSSFRFAFEDAGFGYGYTRPSHRAWVRIDHILADPRWSVTSCRVGPDFGSDHLPVLAEVVLPAPPSPPRH